MGDMFIVYLLSLVFYCKCQFPVNRPFTDRFSPTASRIQTLTAATNRRLLNQFPNHPISNRNSQNLGGINRDTFTVISNAIRRPSSASNFNTNTGLIGMGNIGSIESRFTNVGTASLSRQNPGSAGLVEHVFGNPHGNSHTRGRSLFIDRQQIRINNKTEVSDHQDAVPILPLNQLPAPLLTSPTQDQLLENVMTKTEPQNIENININAISEAELLQLGTSGMSAIGRHAISLNSVADTNLGILGSPWLHQSNSSTEKQLILALLERLIDLQETEKGVLQTSSSNVVLTTPFPEPSLNQVDSGNPPDQLPSTRGQTNELPMATLQKQLFGFFSLGNSNQVPTRNQLTPATSSSSNEDLKHSFNQQQHINDSPSETIGSLIPVDQPGEPFSGSSVKSEVTYQIPNHNPTPRMDVNIKHKHNRNDLKSDLQQQHHQNTLSPDHQRHLMDLKLNSLHYHLVNNSDQQGRSSGIKPIRQHPEMGIIPNHQGMDIKLNQQQPRIDLQPNQKFLEKQNVQDKLTSVITKQNDFLGNLGFNTDNQVTIINAEKEFAKLLTRKVYPDVTGNKGTNFNPYQQALQTIPCQYRGCTTGHYCVTTVKSELYAEFCPYDSTDQCKCSPGCNFQNKFLPENAIERVSSCRKCFCENGVVYCRFTKRCRRIYHMMSNRRRKQYKN